MTDDWDAVAATFETRPVTDVRHLAGNTALWGRDVADQRQGLVSHR